MRVQPILGQNLVSVYENCRDFGPCVKCLMHVKSQFQEKIGYLYYPGIPPGIR